MDYSGLKEVDKLEQHISFGDYKYIYTIKNPNIVGNYFKSVLKYMEEPLCTHSRYPLFKKICEKLYENSDEYILQEVIDII